MFSNAGTGADRTPSPRETIDSARDRAVSVLSAHFVHEHIDLEELEARLEQVARARDVTEIQRLTSGLPALPTDEAVALGVYRPQRVQQAPTAHRVTTVFGDFRCVGRWTVPNRLTVTSLFGDVKLDLREALFGTDNCDLVVYQGVGDIHLVIPPGVRVTTEIVNVFGDREVSGENLESRSNEDILIRVSGVQIIGDVKISVRLPGEPKTASKRRR